MFKCNFLKKENQIYNDLQGGKGIPKTFWFGYAQNVFKNSGKLHNVLVMEFLGNDLDTLFKTQRHFFTLKTVLMLAEQLLTRVEYLHKMNYIHQDIKPENILVGSGKSKSTIYLADFDISKKYYPSNDKYKENVSIEGYYIDYCGNS